MTPAVLVLASFLLLGGEGVPERNQFTWGGGLFLVHSIRGLNPQSLGSITLGLGRHCTSAWKPVAKETHVPHRGCRTTKGRKMLGSGVSLEEHTPNNLTLAGPRLLHVLSSPQSASS